MGIDGPCIPCPTIAGSEPLPSLSTNRRAPMIRGKAATRVQRGAAYESLPPLQRAIRKRLTEHKCYRVELGKPQGSCPASPPPRQHHWQRNGIDGTDMISPSQIGSCRSGNLDTSTIVNETRSTRSQVARRLVASQATGTTAPQAARRGNALDSMTRSHREP